VDEDWMIRSIEHNSQSFGHLARGDFDVPLVGGNRHHKMLNVVLSHKSGVFRGHLFVHKSPRLVSVSCNAKGADYSAESVSVQNRLELPSLQKLKVLRLWIAAAVHDFGLHGSEIVGRNFGDETRR
jgi:hypothetical protein